MNYTEFLRSKAVTMQANGFNVANTDIAPVLFPFQRDIVKWALRRGRAALFADCGLGKGPMALEWSRHISRHTGGDVLVLAPLAVAQQFRREGDKFNIPVTVCKTKSDVRPGINVTNYDRLDNFDPDHFTGIVLDESSRLKAYDGKQKQAILDAFSATPYKLACTATPAPNDHMELGNHAEFMGAMTRAEMLAMFFVHDGGDTSKWRLKGHAESEFWKWVCSWAVMIRRPSDLGYEDDGFILPPLNMHSHVTDSDWKQDGALFALESMSMIDRRNARRGSINQRVSKCVEVVAESDGPWLIWCDLNDEATAITAAIPGAVEIRGTDDREDKERKMLSFTDGTIRVVVTKPSVAGWGMNWQHCNNMAFVGLSDSYEAMYQAIRRCWRYGQTREVECHIITAQAEGPVVSNIQRKEREANRMSEEMAQHMSVYTDLGSTQRSQSEYVRQYAFGTKWSAHQGDCVDVVGEMGDSTVDFTIFSPPFASLYTYSNTNRDMGNCKNDAEFANQFRFLVGELYRVTKPGRLMAVHCMNLPIQKSKAGYIGIHDFRGDLIRMFQASGFIFHSEVCIWKDPVTAVTRTKALGLLYKQLKKDSAMSRQGIPDYLVVMRKPGENPDPVTKDPDEFPVELWQRFASPVWMDIRESDTLQHRSVREDKDERHICPLQLQVIERAIRLWTNPGDLILSPFMGIGSEGYVAIHEGRRFVGAELKGAYYQQAVANLAQAEAESGQPTLFDSLVADVSNG